MNKIIHVYTDGGIRPDPSMPQGTGYGGTGVVVVLASDDSVLFESSTHYPQQETNQRMELLAAIEGLEAIKRLPLVYSSIAVHSDSAYLINCMRDRWWYNWMVNQNGGWKNSSKQPVENADLWRRLLANMRTSYHLVCGAYGPKPWSKLYLQEDRDAIRAACDGGLDNVTFVKVKGHAGIPLNERADQLATAGKNGATEQRVFTMERA
jgi:ribonuclease HI